MAWFEASTVTSRRARGFSSPLGTPLLSALLRETGAVQILTLVAQRECITSAGRAIMQIALLPLTHFRAGGSAYKI